MQQNSLLKKLYPVILVTVVVFVSVFFLSFANRFTAPKIKAQEDAAILAPLKSMFPDMTGSTTENDVYILKANDKTVGYAFLATGMGYKGEIKILVALQDETTVKGIVVISQSETPNLGSRITLPSFLNMFSGKKIEDIKLSSEGGQIDALTGSTISSRAVVDAVRNTALAKVQALPKS